MSSNLTLSVYSRDPGPDRSDVFDMKKKSPHQVSLVLKISLLLILAVSPASALSQYQTALPVNILGEIINVNPERGLLVVRETHGAKERRRFYAHARQLRGLSAGDTVRVHLRKGSRWADMIVKMTKLEYGQGQNLGMIYRKPTHTAERGEKDEETSSR